MIPSWAMELKKALDLLLEAYTPETTLNDINLILSIVISKEVDGK